MHLGIGSKLCWIRNLSNQLLHNPIGFLIHPFALFSPPSFVVPPQKVRVDSFVMDSLSLIGIHDLCLTSKTLLITTLHIIEIKGLVRLRTSEVSFEDKAGCILLVVGRRNGGISLCLKIGLQTIGFNLGSY